jgi:serine/threonine protein kinase
MKVGTTLLLELSFSPVRPRRLVAIDGLCAFCWALVANPLPSDTIASSTVNLNQFRLLRVVGKGAFGKVRIVERKDSGLTFALKYIRKDEGELEIGPNLAIATG